MSDYLFSRLRLGDIITFRYEGSLGSNNMPRDVLVIAPNYLGHLHAIKLNGLTPAEQEYLQQLLYVSNTNPVDIFAPLEAQIERRKKEIDIMNQEKNELIRSGQRVVMAPVPQQMMGAIDRVKQVMGSVIGKVSTFGPTQVQPQQPANKAQIDLQAREHDKIIQQRMQELNQMVASVQKNRQLLSSLPKVPTNPYYFYHAFLKSFIGSGRRMSSIYRKYNIAKIKNPRILRSVGLMPNAQRR